MRPAKYPSRSPGLLNIDDKVVVNLVLTSVSHHWPHIILNTLNSPKVSTRGCKDEYFPTRVVYHLTYEY